MKKIHFLVSLLPFIMAGTNPPRLCIQEERVKTGLSAKEKRSLNMAEFTDLMNKNKRIDFLTKKMITALWSKEIKRDGGRYTYSNILAVSKMPGDFSVTAETLFIPGWAPFLRSFSAPSGSYIKNVITDSIVNYPVGVIYLIGTIATQGKYQQQLAQKIGLYEPDVISQHFLNVSELKEDEAVLILNLMNIENIDFTKRENLTLANLKKPLDAYQAVRFKLDYLRGETDATKVVIVDANSNDLQENLNTIRTTVRRLQQQKKNIVKVAILAHGFPGYVAYGSSKSGLDVKEDLPALFLKTDLSKLLNAQTHIYFNSCLLAGNKEGKDKVNAFATQVLPSGGTVTTNTFLSLEGGQFNELKDPKSFSSVASQLMPFAVTGLIIRAGSYVYLRYQDQINEDPQFLLEPQLYEFRVP